MCQSGQALGDRPEAIEPQGVHRQAIGASPRSADPWARGRGVRPGRAGDVTGPVPRVFAAPALSHMPQQRFDGSPQNGEGTPGNANPLQRNCLHG
jgi:hypothetical protein